MFHTDEDEESVIVEPADLPEETSHVGMSEQNDAAAADCTLEPFVHYALPAG